MKDRTLIRPIVRADLPALKRVIASTDLFPPNRLDGMIEGHWNGSTDPAVWLTYGVHIRSPLPMRRPSR